MRHGATGRGAGGFTERQRSALDGLRLPAHRIARPALLRRLDRLTSYTRVSGPPGSGRTTLLADWATHRMNEGDHVLWMSAHRGLDSWEDFDRSLAYLAGDQVEPGPRSALEQICAGADGARVILIVDDGDLLADGALRARLVDLCRTLPMLHLVGTTGDLAPVPEDPRGTGLSFTLLTGRDLTATPDEAHELTRAWGLERTDDQIADALQASGGWLGLLRELLEDDVPRYPRAVQRFRPSLSASPVEAALIAVLGAVARLGDVSAALLTYLEGAVPDVWREIGADALTPLAPVVEDSGLLAPVDDGERGALALVPALRESFAGDFAARHAEAARALHAAAAQYYEDTGVPADTARSAVHARRAEDWTRLTRLAARHGWWLGARHPEATVAAYGGLADDVVAERPVLLLTRELSHALHPSTIDPDPRSPMIQRVFARTVQSAGAGPADPDERAFLAIAVVNALRQRGTPEAAVRAAEAQRPALTPGWQDVSALNRSFFYLQAGMAAAEVGDLPRAMRRFARGYDESGGEQSQFVACSVAGHHALLLAFEGRRAAAVQWAERAERGAAGQPWIQRIAAPPVRLARAYLALDTADSQGAEQIVADSDLTLSIFEMWPLLVDVLARAALAAGQIVTGLDVIEHTSERQYLRRPPTPLSTVLLARARCDLLIADGQLTRASLLLERATADPAAASAPPVLRHLLAVEDARLQLIAGRPQTARSRVARCLAEEPVRRQALDLLVIDAAAVLAQGREDDAARSIGRVVSMTPDDQLAALLRGVDPDTRGGLVELVRGARAEAIRGIPDLLTATPLYPAGGELVELTERERSVLASLAQGATLADIARADVLSVNTVKKQAGSLYRRLGAETRAEALRTAAALGFLDGSGRAAQ